MDSSLNCPRELPSLQRKEGKALEIDLSRTAATEESEQEESPSADEEASEVAAVKEELAEKWTERAEDTVLSAQGIRLLHSKLQNRHQQPNIYRSPARARKEAKGQKAPKEKGARASPTRAARARVCVIFSRRQEVVPELIVVSPTPVEGARWLDPADNHIGALLQFMKK